MKRVVAFLTFSFLISCTPPNSTTGTGAAIGGAVGAGVGGIIGSQTGDPGAGFLLGGLAGAGTGTAIGNVVQYKDEELASRDEEIARQQRLISSQEREIQQLRHESRDQVVFNNSSSSNLGVASSAADSGSYASNSALGSITSVAPNNSMMMANTNTVMEGNSGFAPRFDNKPIPVTAGGAIVSENSFAPKVVTPSSVPSNLAMNNAATGINSSSQLAEPRYSAKIEPISRGYYGSAAANTNTSKAPAGYATARSSAMGATPSAVSGSSSAAIISSSTSVVDRSASLAKSNSDAATKTLEAATASAAKSAVITAPIEPAVVESAPSEDSSYTNTFRPGEFALSDSDSTEGAATASRASANALSFSKLEQIKKSNTTTEASISAPDVEKSADISPDLSAAALSSAAIEKADNATKKVVTPEVPAVEQAAPLRLATSENLSSECSDASAEVKSATQASELADKLFHYRRALRLCPTNSDFHSGLAKVYLALDRRDDAKFELEEALRINPTNSDAKAQLDKLK